MRIALFLVLVLLTAAGCGPVTSSSLVEQSGAIQLDAGQVLALTEGNTLFVHNINEDSYLFFDPSGRLFAKDIFNNADLGRWDVSEDGELCMRMRRWWYGDLRCYQVLGDGSTYHLANSAGVLAFSAEKLNGDAKSLAYTVKEDRKKSARKSARAAAATPPGESAAPAGATTGTGAGHPQSQASGPAVSGPAVSEPAAANAASGDIQATVSYMAKDCPGCNLANVDLYKADLIEAKLAGANLSGANLRMANLRRADLKEANLQGTDLSYANLPGADLRGADLRKARFRGANLIRANFSGAQLEGADFTDALLEGTEGLGALGR